jgi:hypothetical protein
VFLEAGLLDREIEAQRAHLSRVIQVFRTEDIGEPAARELERLLSHKGLPTVNRALPPEAGAAELSRTLEDTSERDALVLWLRPADLAALPEKPPRHVLVLSSGLLGNLEHSPLPLAWREVTRITYPFELPNQRASMSYFMEWTRLRGIQIKDERIQADTYLACVILARTLERMQDRLVREYLLEQVEDSLGSRTSDGYYPRLSLAPGQRFGSKGGYIARFIRSTGTELLAEGEWTTP